MFMTEPNPSLPGTFKHPHCIQRKLGGQPDYTQNVVENIITYILYIVVTNNSRI